MKLLICFLLFASFIMPQAVFAENENNDVDSKIKALENQISAMQSQLDELKGMVSSQSKEKDALEAKVKDLESGQKPFLARATKSGSFKLQDAVGLDEESKLNIAGEVVMRYRQNEKSDASSHGFQFYEAELFLDAAPHKNLSAYIEYDLIHENHAQAEDIWIDLHTQEGPFAFAGGTGMKIGNFHYPFGWDNDDEEGYVYGGRTSANTTLMRNQRIDGWLLRERQVGLAAYYNFDPLRDLNLSAVVGVFNGTGDVNHYSGTDSDSAKDLTTRLEAKYKDFVFGASYLSAPHTRGVTANVNNTAHIRDIRRYGVHFKYPDVPFPSHDVSLGGMPWLIWGEFLLGDNKANSNIASANVSQHVRAGYIELDAAIKQNKLLGFLRYDYYDPNTKTSRDSSFGITPGVKWNIFNSSYLVLEYEIYGGGKNAPASITKEDRFAAQLTTQF